MKRAIIVAAVAAALIAAIVFVPKAGGLKTGAGEILATSTDAVPIRGEDHEPINNKLAERAKKAIGTEGGECVYFVQQFLKRLENCESVDCEKKTFRGHANHIKPNATEPRIGSAVLIRYKTGGHSAVVIGIENEEIEIVESNLKLDGVVDVRKIKRDDPKILGYYDFRPEVIDEYFEARKMPLEGTGAIMVAAADKYEIDWRLVPAIAVRESSGGKKSITPNNPFGWGSSSKIEFKTIGEAIDRVAWNLGGWNPGTAYAYAGRGTEAKLKAYNPPSVVPTYAAEVMAIMKAIDDGMLQ